MASQNLTPLFTKGIEEQVFTAIRPWKPAWRRLFHIRTTDKRYVDHQTWQGYGLPVFRMPGGRVQQGGMQPSYGKRYVMRSFGLGDSFAKEDIADDLYGVITKGIASVGGGIARAFMDLLETDTSSFLGTNGFASGTVVGMSDGKSLFNTAHPISSNNSATTVANRPSTDVDLSVSSIQAAITNLRTQKYPNNLTYMQNNPRCIWINPSQSFIAKQVLTQSREPFTFDYNENFISSYNIDIVEWPYWTTAGSTGTTNAWGMLGDEHYLNFFMRTQYDVDSDFDVNTKSQIVTVDCRFDEGATDWRGSYGSKGA